MLLTAFLLADYKALVRPCRVSDGVGSVRLNVAGGGIVSVLKGSFRSTNTHVASRNSVRAVDCGATSVARGARKCCLLDFGSKGLIR